MRIAVSSSTDIRHCHGELAKAWSIGINVKSALVYKQSSDPRDGRRYSSRISLMYPYFANGGRNVIAIADFADFADFASIAPSRC
jgi:hypothetical protein